MAIAALLIAACSKGEGARPECDGYAEKLADGLGADPSRRQTVIEGARSACVDGRIEEGEISCVAAATNPDAIRACQGLAPETAPGAVENAPTRPPDAAPSKTTGTSRVALVRVERGAIAWNPDAPTAEEAAWYAKLQQNVAACATAETFAPRTEVVVVQLGDGTPFVDARSLPETLRSCLSSAFGEPRPSTVPAGSLKLTIDLGGP